MNLATSVPDWTSSLARTFEELFFTSHLDPLQRFITLIDPRYILRYLEDLSTLRKVDLEQIEIIIHIICTGTEVNFHTPFAGPRRLTVIEVLEYKSLVNRKIAASYFLVHKCNLQDFALTEERAHQILDLQGPRKLSTSSTQYSFFSALTALPAHVHSRHLTSEDLDEICIADGSYDNLWAHLWSNGPHNSHLARHIEKLISLHLRGKIKIGLASRSQALDSCYRSNWLEQFAWLLLVTDHRFFVPSGSQSGTKSPSQVQMRQLIEKKSQLDRAKDKRKAHIPSVAARYYVALTSERLTRGTTRDEIARRIVCSLSLEMRHLICTIAADCVEVFIPEDDIVCATHFYNGYVHPKTSLTPPLSPQNSYW